ncbi:hypothetical protein [Flavobacterium channae]|nr:hypothetical protein [Flavobacterium channae]UGS23667.1 hypothetical protein LOS89_13050 [Flavobacterium channae]
MIPLGVIGPFQVMLLILTLTFPIILFFLGYYLGKKSDYKKRVIEEELKK